MNKIRSFTDASLYTEDADTPQGREIVKDFHNVFDQGRAQNLDFTTWLPFAAKTYKISPSIEDYVVSVTPICPSDIPNRNGVGFPLAELKAFAPPPMNRMVYKCWTACPLHLEHDNEDYTKAFGIVLDTSLHKIKQYGGGSLWKVMGLVATDKRKHPDIAQRVLNKTLDTYSMGSTASHFSCSLCATEIVYDRKGNISSCCEHIDPSSDLDFHPFEDVNGQIHAIYRNAHGLSPFELSLVEDPAWTVALGDTLLKL